MQEEEYSRILIEKDAVINRQDTEIQKLKNEKEKLKQDLSHAAKPSVFLGVFKEKLKSRIQGIVNREIKIRKMEEAMKEMKSELARKDEQINEAQEQRDMSEARMKAVVELEKEPVSFEEECMPQSREEALRKYFGQKIDLRDLAISMSAKSRQEPDAVVQKNTDVAADNINELSENTDGKEKEQEAPEIRNDSGHGEPPQDNPPSNGEESVQNQQETTHEVPDVGSDAGGGYNPESLPDGDPTEDEGEPDWFNVEPPQDDNGSEPQEEAKKEPQTSQTEEEKDAEEEKEKAFHPSEKHSEHSQGPAAEKQEKKEGQKKEEEKADTEMPEKGKEKSQTEPTANGDGQNSEMPPEEKKKGKKKKKKGQGEKRQDSSSAADKEKSVQIRTG